MATYHVNIKGEAGLCRAKEENCPFGDLDHHYPTLDAAREAYEAEQNAFNGTAKKLSSLKSYVNTSFLSKDNAPDVFEIVLEGGPGGGKSSFLNGAREWLEAEGITCLTVPETATIFLNGGVNMAKVRESPTDPMAVDNAILAIQLEMRKQYRKMAQAMGGKVAIIYDRGEADSLAYSSQKQYTSDLAKYGLNPNDVYTSYDMVLYLESPAKDMPQHYTTATNNVRTETPAQAAATDRRTLEAWLPANPVVIGSYENFDEKMKAARQALSSAITQKYETLQAPKKATPANGTALLELKNDVVDQAYGDLGSEKLNAWKARFSNEKYLLKKLSSPTTSVFYSGSPQRPSGMVSLEDSGEGRGYLGNLYVRDQGVGHGKRLLETALDEAKDRRYGTVVADVFDTSSAARGLLEERGFREVSSYEEKSLGVIVHRLELSP